MRFARDGADTRAAAAVRNAEGLVQVEVRHVGTESTRRGKPDERVQVSAVDIDLAAIRMNDLACGDHAVIPVVHRPGVTAVSNKLKPDLSGWDNDMGSLANWYREA